MLKTLTCVTVVMPGPTQEIALVSALAGVKIRANGLTPAEAELPRVAPCALVRGMMPDVAEER